MLRIYLDTAGRIILLKSWWQQQNISGEKTEKVEWGNSFSGRWTFRVYETRFDDVSWWYSFCSSFFFCAVKANTETGDGVGARVSRIQKTPRKMLKKERIFLENSRRNNGISIEEETKQSSWTKNVATQFLISFHVLESDIKRNERSVEFQLSINKTHVFAVAAFSLLQIFA